MPPAFASGLALALEAYAAIGVLFAAAFVTIGVHRVDHRAAGTSWGFRLLILPGSALWWPLLLRRWIRGEASS